MGGFDRTMPPLEDMIFHWGSAYDIFGNDLTGWTARRKDGQGPPLNADSAEVLRDQIRADYNMRRMSRDVS